MWGRSNMYRFAAIAPLAWGKDINAGWMRRIASGCLLQFLQNPNFIYSDGVPTPGFYGLFDPVLQGYSCRGSVYWCAKAFLPLMLPESHPYWSETENEGFWADMKAGEVNNLWLPGPGMLITNYADSGASETRAFCNYDTERRGAEKFRGTTSVCRRSGLMGYEHIPGAVSGAPVAAYNGDGPGSAGRSGRNSGRTPSLPRTVRQLSEGGDGVPTWFRHRVFGINEINSITFTR